MLGRGDGVVGQVEQLEVALRDRAGADERGADPVEQAVPEGRAEEDDGEGRGLPGLDQRQRLERLVEGAEAARKHDVALGRLHEADLAGVEVLEGVGEIDVGVDALLVRELDPEADREARRPPGRRGSRPPSRPGRRR